MMELCDLKQRQMKRILVTGATGHLGSAVIETLWKEISPEKISIITRKEEKRAAFENRGFNAFTGNYDDLPSLKHAMKDVDMVLLISSGDQGDRLQEHKNVVDAAKEMHVKTIAYTSRSLRNKELLANKLMVEHFETEDYIRASGLQYLFFRNILYMDAIPQFIGGNAALEKGIFLPAGNGKVAFALRSELGEAIANVLLHFESGNQVYNFTGSKAWTFQDVAAALSELSGKEVPYTNVSENTFVQLMEQKGIPEHLVKKIVDFVTDIKNDQEADIYNDLEVALGRKPTGLREGLKIILDL